MRIRRRGSPSKGFIRRGPLRAGVERGRRQAHGRDNARGHGLDAKAIIEQDVSRVSRRDPGPSSSAREGVNVVGHFGSSPGSVLRRGA